MSKITDRLDALKKRVQDLTKSTADGRAELPHIALDKGMDAHAKARTKVEAPEAEMEATQSALALAVQRAEDERAEEAAASHKEIEASIKTLASERAKLAQQFDQDVAGLQCTWADYEDCCRKMDRLAKTLPDRPNVVKDVHTRKSMLGNAFYSTAPNLARAMGMKPPLRQRKYRLSDVL